MENLFICRFSENVVLDKRSKARLKKISTEFVIFQMLLSWSNNFFERFEINGKCSIQCIFIFTVAKRRFIRCALFLEYVEESAWSTVRNPCIIIRTNHYSRDNSLIMSDDQLKTRAHLLDPFGNHSSDGLLLVVRLMVACHHVLSVPWCSPYSLDNIIRQSNYYTYVHFIWLSTEIRTTARNYFWLKPFPKTKGKLWLSRMSDLCYVWHRNSNNSWTWTKQFPSIRRLTAF